MKMLKNKSGQLQALLLAPSWILIFIAVMLAVLLIWLGANFLLVIGAVLAIMGAVAIINGKVTKMSFGLVIVGAILIFWDKIKLLFF